MRGSISKNDASLGVYTPLVFSFFFSKFVCSGVLVCFFLSTIYNGVSGVALGVLVVVASSHTLGYLFILFLFLLSFSGASTGLAQ
ncbi:uncharacterized protein B0P05DRAFT_544944 [Gilbertella persicaria]|uniref:uncharacterized protein n=1 Tax=Gilbertella persicaria TaxID=101096 RepID=UPI00221EDC62|nr:uncharacterized protein B0P05DRAFT_544944 [Gilbertella persicaria]KAI8076558.1 hypothetical protein B0P05DRAFT_544944 [Gilbertella persicaria]